VEAEQRPQAKEGGVFAGLALLIREIAELIAASGGVIVVIIGVGALGTITAASLSSVPDAERATVATAAFSVLGTIIGAYFGLRVGQKGKEEADQARQVATAKVERLAAEVEPSKAKDILDEVDRGESGPMPTIPGGF
jgi:class 3 adenylate cyclase